MFHDICLQAYRLDGVDAVNSLLKQQFPTDADRVRAMEELQDTGYWSIAWHEKKHPDGGMYRDFGSVKAYLGDEDEQ